MNVRVTAVKSNRAGRRDDLGGRYFRSSMEANLARFWQWRVKIGDLASWEYEPQEFALGEHRRNNFYRPDFKINFRKPESVFLAFEGETYQWIACEYVWVEAKGWMDNDSRIRIERFLEVHKMEPLRIIDWREYNGIVAGASGFVSFEKEEKKRRRRGR